LRSAGPQLIENLKQVRQPSTENGDRVEQEVQRWQRLEQELRRSKDELELERRGRLDVQRRVEQLEQEGDERSRIEQQAERVAQNLQRLRGDLEREREERLEAQRRAKQLEQEQQHLKRELDRSKEELKSVGRPPAPDRAGQPEVSRPWRRKPTLIVGLLFGIMAAWFTSLVVALNLLSS
jgi:hypothetical protein